MSPGKDFGPLSPGKDFGKDFAPSKDFDPLSPGKDFGKNFDPSYLSRTATPVTWGLLGVPGTPGGAWKRLSIPLYY